MSNLSSFPPAAVGGLALGEPAQSEPAQLEPNSWPEGLRAIFDLILASRFPMFLAMGHDLRLFYNDAYSDLLGDKHPAAHGAPYASVRPELWERMRPYFELVLAGEATQLQHALMEFERNGKRERRFFSVSLSPVRHAGQVAGVYCVLTETTSDVLSEHRHAFHQKLGETLEGLDDAIHIIKATSAMTGQTLGAARVGYGEIDPAGRTVNVDRDWTDGRMASLGGMSHVLDDFGPEIAAMLRQGRTVRIDDVAADPRSAPCAAAYAGIGARAVVIVPIIEEARLAAVFYLHEPSARHWTEQETAMAEDVARHTREVVRRSRLEETLRDAALERDALLQSERLARVQAERLSHAKDEFLAMLAHELRNPLAPISSSASLLSMQFSSEPRICQTSSIISRQVKHMSRLIDDLLDVSRVTRGLVKLKLATVDFREVVTGALDQTRPLVLEKAHQVRVELPETPVWVRGDQTRLVQSVANIVNNAAKYTQKGGQLVLALEAVDGRMVLRVRDNGSGMPPDLVPSVFDLFTQGARTLARSQGGLGLGLTLVKRLIDLHEGEVAAHSDGVGLGSTFTLTLPCVTGACDGGDMQPGDPEAARAVLQRKLRVLIVDDNSDAADSLANLLQVQGHATSVEYDAESALRRARAERPDVMLIDIGLPDVDGYQLASALRSLPETAATVPVAVTGYGQAKDRERALQAGFAHHLVKPVDMTALVRILESSAALAAVAEAASTPVTPKPASASESEETMAPA
ncbi:MULTISPECIES: ATP-binding protein [Massilia]|uniref:hybrid sensor histidine kinase/response regulator n=1 Tax=Massilia TaxID=149698 RepID=UPI001C6398B9|nr:MULTISPECIES: ATP-binding protein [Massilia]QYG01558.1 response regulator [Massilia sp. NP310]